MDARHSLPVPPDLDARLKSLSNDLQRARVNLATGKLHPEHYEVLARALQIRLEALEAEVHTRMLASARAGRVAAWQPRGPVGG